MNDDDLMHLKRLGWAPGGYIIRCSDCSAGANGKSEWPLGAKGSRRCRECALDAMHNEAWDMLETMVAKQQPTTRDGWMEAVCG